MIEVKIGLHRSSTGANTLNVRPEFAEIPYKSRDCVGRGKRIRTSGPCLPKTVLYQAELFPDRSGSARAPLGRSAPI